MSKTRFTRIEIAIVDDDHQDVVLIKKALLDLNIGLDIHHYYERTSIMQFIESLRNESTRHPNLIILDLDMPKISGFVVLDAIKQDIELRLIPVIVMSHSDIPETIEMCYRKYANSYIVKPPSYEELKVILNNLCDYWFNNVNCYIKGYNVF